MIHPQSMNIVPRCFIQKTPVFASDMLRTSATETIKRESSGCGAWLDTLGEFFPPLTHYGLSQKVKISLVSVNLPQDKSFPCS